MTTYRFTTQQAKDNCIREMHDLPIDGKWICTIEPYKEKKTDHQRGFWHLLLKAFGDETGYTMQEMKDLVKKDILGTKIVKLGGHRVEVIASSETEDKIGYSNLIDQTYRIAAECGVQLPNPMWMR